jgi:hypothetical protein
MLITKTPPTPPQRPGQDWANNAARRAHPATWADAGRHATIHATEAGGPCAELTRFTTDQPRRERGRRYPPSRPHPWAGRSKITQVIRSHGTQSGSHCGLCCRCWPEVRLTTAARDLAATSIPAPGPASTNSRNTPGCDDDAGPRHDRLHQRSSWLRRSSRQPTSLPGASSYPRHPNTAAACHLNRDTTSPTGPRSASTDRYQLGTKSCHT